MIIRQLEEIVGSERELDEGQWVNRGLVLARDKMDFSFHEMKIKASHQLAVWHKHHYEAVYCIEGEGEISIDGESHPLAPGTVYVADKHDPHLIKAKTDLKLMCVFSPPLTGQEVHDSEGTYPLLAPRKALRMKNIMVIGLNDFNLRALESIRNADNYNYVPLLSPEDVLERTEYPVEEIITQARRQIAEFPERIDGLIHYIDFPVSTIVPILCKELGLPSASLPAVLKCEHKYWSRVEQQKCMPQNVPEFRAFDPFDDNALEKIGLPFPFWIKPVKSFSSYLGFRIKDEKDWARAIEETRANIGRFANPFDYLLNQVELPDEVKGIGGGYCVAEAIIGGRQCTQEGYVHKGKVHVYGTVDSLRDPNGSSFSSYQYPSRLPATVRKRMERLTTRYMEQVGYDNAPFNAEYFWDANEDRIWFLEANTRISESHTALFWKVDGASHHEVAVDLSLGHRPRLPHRQGDFACAGKFFIRRHKDAFVKSVPSEADIERLQSVMPGTDVRILPEPGKRLSDMMDQDSYTYVLALLWIGGANHNQLQRRFEKVVDMLPFELEP